MRKKELSLKERIRQMPEHSILFRSDFPEYHAEYVGAVFKELTEESTLVRVAQGIYARPIPTRFGLLPPSEYKIVNEIAERDHVKILPIGPIASNALGLSTQVPMKYNYLTSGGDRTLIVNNVKISMTHAAPRNFRYKTKLVSLLVQALRDIRRYNIEEEELQVIRKLVSEEKDRESLTYDVDLMPAWMRKIVKPMLAF